MSERASSISSLCVRFGSSAGFVISTAGCAISTAGCAISSATVSWSSASVSPCGFSITAASKNSCVADEVSETASRASSKSEDSLGLQAASILSCKICAVRLSTSAACAISDCCNLANISSFSVSACFVNSTASITESSKSALKISCWTTSVRSCSSSFAAYSFRSCISCCMISISCRCASALTAIPLAISSSRSNRFNLLCIERFTRFSFSCRSMCFRRSCFNLLNIILITGMIDTSDIPAAAFFLLWPQVKSSLFSKISAFFCGEPSEALIGAPVGALTPIGALILAEIMLPPAPVLKAMSPIRTEEHYKRRSCTVADRRI
mmetsp:Transcript_9133/g.15679  ORF Transcript_9133/g.15679 Transcript_9133/m.15679 type:complete len:323 (+) Transcript_9133:895-1863(+)